MDIIQVIIFIVIIAVAIVQQISKAAKKENATSPKDVLADMFPDIEEAEPVVFPASPPEVTKPQYPRKQSRPMPVPKQTVAQEAENKKPNSSPIKLNTREKARQAFIYSEIFNRKY